MRLGSGTYKEIALDALKGNWVKAAVAGLFANWLGVFSSSFLFIAKYAFIAVILIYFLEFLPGFYSILFIGTTAIALIYFFIGGAVRLGYIDFNLALLDRRKNGIACLTGRMSDWWRVLCAKITLFFVLSLGYILFIYQELLRSIHIRWCHIFLKNGRVFQQEKHFGHQNRS